jgi:PAS domain S-box-containing protein
MIAFRELAVNRDRICSLVKEALEVSTCQISLVHEQVSQVFSVFTQLAPTKHTFLRSEHPSIQMSPWQWVIAVPLHNEHGAIIGNLWIADSNERQPTEKQTKLSEQFADFCSTALQEEIKHAASQRYLAMCQKYIDTCSSSIGIIDRDFRNLYVNETATNISGLSRESHIGKNMWELGISQEIISGMKPWFELIARIFQTGESEKLTFEFDAAGHPVKLTTLGIPLFNENQEVIAILNASVPNNDFSSFIRPIHLEKIHRELVNEIALHRQTQVQLANLNNELERRIQERTSQLEISQKHAEESAKAKSIFLANASHELRTPMNGIMGMTDLLGQTPLSDEQRDFANTLMLCAEQMIALINNILDYSKVEAGRMEQDPEPFGVRQLMASVGAMLRESARAKGLDFAFKIDAEVPQTLIGDSVKIIQVLTNLASNAIKFTASGKVHIQVDCLPGDSSQIRFAVHDTGIGINSSDMGKLFNSFTQADASMTRRFGGTGLGLAISKQLVELMGGTISVESVPGEGSTFCFILPLTVGEEQVIPAIQTTENHPALQRLDAKILVVEDNMVNQIVLLRHLKQLGFTNVAIANNGLQAVTATGGTDFDLILMDCQMPELDGFEATSIIRSRTVGKRLPIIAITALSNLDERERCQASGMDGFLQKPYTREELEMMLQHFLEVPQSK